jgi:A/G-specific adenine glycosylase
VGISVSPSGVTWLRRRLRTWFVHSGRDFPWRRSQDPYAILLAELLLQRTRADLVPAVYERFLRRYPDPWALAAAENSEVLELLRPLGFVHRSARLPALGRVLVEQFEGRVPSTERELLTLPGVGRYVANAVLLLGFGKARPLLDPNVIRLLERVFDLRSARSRAREDPELWATLRRIVPRRNPAPVALALIDLGAVVCSSNRPRCAVCPLRPRCTAFQAGTVTPRQAP